MRHLFLFFLFLFSQHAGAQRWEPIQPWNTTRRMCAIAFSHGGVGYVGLGHDYNTKYPFDDLGIYDPVQDKWIREIDLDIPRRTCAFSFLYGGGLYIGGGTRDSGRTALRDFYRIDLKSFTVDTLEEMPMLHASGSRAHIAGDTAYVVGGCEAQTCEGQLWRYAINAHAWSVADTLRTESSFGTSFLLGRKLYYGGGSSPLALVDNRFWAYDLDSGKTVELPALPDPTRTMGVCTAISDSEAVMGTGFAYNGFARAAGQSRRYGPYYWRAPAVREEGDFLLQDMWRFNAGTGRWTKLPRFPDKRRNAVVFALGNYIYVMQGNDFKGSSKGGYQLKIR